MKPTQQLHDSGQSLWLDNITRALLTSGTLGRYVDDLSIIVGLTSSPSIFDLAIKDSNSYDDAIRQKTKEGKSGEALFFELAIEDLSRPPISFGGSMTHRRPRWLGVFGGISAIGARCGQHGQRSRSAPHSGATNESLHQDSRDQRSENCD